MPPPAPMKAQMKPITAPQTLELDEAFCGETAFVASFVVTTGWTMNFTPRSSVINTEKFPMAAEGTKLDTQLPTNVKPNTETIITTPLRMSRFLLFRMCMRRQR